MFDVNVKSNFVQEKTTNFQKDWYSPRVLAIDGFGKFIGLTSERISIREKGRNLEEVPLFQVEQVLIIGEGVSLSSDLIFACAQRGIPITFITNSGKPFAQLSSPFFLGTIETRREQILSYFDFRGFEISRFLIQGKIRNQISTLMYFSRHRKIFKKEVFDFILSCVKNMEKVLTDLENLPPGTIEAKRENFLSMEGKAANFYWEGISKILPSELLFAGRERKGALDLVNCSLNYNYGILYQQVWNALVLAGLDPFAGFLHADRPGKPSLVFDFIEEFRSFVVDRPLISFFSKGGKVILEGEKISQQSRRELAGIFFERLEEGHLFEGKKQKIKNIIRLQARKMAGFFRGKGNINLLLEDGKCLPWLFTIFRMIV